MSSDVIFRLTSIFETGIFYNAAIDIYFDQIQLVDDLNEIVLSYPSDIQKYILFFISRYHLEKNSEQAKLFIRELSALSSNPKLISIVNNIKLKLMLTWDLDILNKELRQKLHPENLLNEYFNIYRITNGFKVFNEKDLESILERLSILELFRKENFFFKHIVNIHRDSERGTIHIFYDESRTSFRQALVFAHQNSAGNDTLEFVKETISSSNLKNYSGILMSLSFNQEIRKNSISKETYYKKIHDKYIVLNNADLNDKRIIYRGSKKLDALKSVIKSKYELNAEDFINQEKIFNRESISKIDDRVSAYVTVQSALSAYVNFYAFIIAKLDFFEKLYELNQLITRDFSKQCEPRQLDGYVSYLFNHLNYAVKSSNKNKLDEEVAYINTKYSPQLKILRSYNVQKNHWGYFINNEIFPNLEGIITIISLLREKTGGDLSSISHEQLDSLGLTDTLKRAMIINLLIPLKSSIINAGYGKSDHAIVTPMNDMIDVPGNIRAALRLYDNNAKNDFLISTISTTKTNKVEELIWGLFHHYEKDFSKVKVTNRVTLDRIDKIYKKTVLESRFISGLQASKEIINTFR